MRILITGGAGSIGSYLAKYFSMKGYEIRILDREPWVDNTLSNASYDYICGQINDPDAVISAVEDVDYIFHLAWSFAAAPAELFAIDAQGLALLLEAASKSGVKHFINTSSAIVYGSPQVTPICEEHPYLTSQARKPFYAFAKTCCEQLCKLYNDLGQLSTTTINLWWAFADEIGGKHLKQMVKDIKYGGQIDIPANSGGSFVHMQDIAFCFEKVLNSEIAFGQSYNVASDYVTWQDIAVMIADLCNHDAQIRIIAPEQWQGSAFQVGEWRLDTSKAMRDLGFYSVIGSAEFRKQLKAAIGELCRKI